MSLSNSTGYVVCFKCRIYLRTDHNGEVLYYSQHALKLSLESAGALDGRKREIRAS